MNLLKKIKNIFMKLLKLENDEVENIVNYIFSAESLPEPLPTEREVDLVSRFQKGASALLFSAVALLFEFIALALYKLYSVL